MKLLNQLTQRVTIEQPVTADDGYGGKTLTWAALATVFAAVDPLPGNAESVVADQRQATRAYRVRIRLREDVRPTMRLVWKGRVLLIHSLHEQDQSLSLLAYEENV